MFFICFLLYYTNLRNNKEIYVKCVCFGTFKDSFKQNEVNEKTKVDDSGDNLEWNSKLLSVSK